MFPYFTQRLLIKDSPYMNRKLFSRSPILVALFGSTLLGNFLNSPAIAQPNNSYPTIQIAQRDRASRQPSMEQALSSLKDAEDFLKRATSDKGGHRVKALEFVKQAMKETQQGIEYDRTHKNENNAGSQRTMRQALSSLQEVQKLLRSATPDKGGHRVKAIQLVEQAIQETQRGIEYDRTHGND